MLLSDVVRTELRLQFLWATLSLSLAYAGPFGMFALVAAVSRYSGGPIGAGLVLSGALVGTRSRAASTDGGGAVGAPRDGLPRCQVGSASGG